MSEMPVTPAEAPKKSNLGLIITVVIVGLFCCICIILLTGWWLWNNGDSLVSFAQIAI